MNKYQHLNEEVDVAAAIGTWAIVKMTGKVLCLLLWSELRLMALRIEILLKT